MIRGRPFPKGKSGNKGGRPKKNPIIAKFKETTYEDFIFQLQRYGVLTKDQMKEDLKRPDCTMFEHIFGRIVIDAAQGEKDARQVLLDRLWGKVKEKIEHSGTNTNDVKVIITLPDNGTKLIEDGKSE